jgi:hypothetical protein
MLPDALNHGGRAGDEERGAAPKRSLRRALRGASVTCCRSTSIGPHSHVRTPQAAERSYCSVFRPWYFERYAVRRVGGMSSRGCSPTTAMSLPVDVGTRRRFGANNETVNYPAMDVVRAAFDGQRLR